MEAAQEKGGHDPTIPGPKHNQDQPVVWERWQKKRTFVRALEGTYSHLTKELLDQPRVISSKSVPWKGGPNLYGKHVIAPGAAARSPSPSNPTSRPMRRAPTARSTAI